LCCSEDRTKDNLKVAIGYLLQTSAQVLQGLYLSNGLDDREKEVKKFLKVQMGEIFGEAQYKATLRRPAELPAESDVQRLRDYCVSQMAELGHMLDTNQYRKLRATIVTRLTLFNARRCGEPAAMTLDEFDAARKGEWIDRQQVELASDEEYDMLKRFKLAYQAGNGTRDLVPVLIPEDTYLNTGETG